MRAERAVVLVDIFGEEETYTSRSFSSMTPEVFHRIYGPVVQSFFYIGLIGEIPIYQEALNPIEIKAVGVRG